MLLNPSRLVSSSCQVVYESSGVTEQYPVLEYKTMQVSVSYCNSLVGITESSKSIAEKLALMGLEAQADGEDEVTVTVPPTRCDSCPLFGYTVYIYSNTSYL